ncbi:Transposon Tf2-1 polyprotein [Ceratobasidium sp. AG-Ba]|nr:Transposon Tf2-1 polyprotein [Ceratobasidium sp. AG-Ba]
MPIPSYSWQSIGVDFVGPLPESETRYGAFDMITTVTDNLTRMVHLTPTRQDYTAKDIAEVIFEHVYKLHGMPEHIVSDRDSLFTSTFWTRLNELTKTKLRMSSSCHPQTDGIIERVHRAYTRLLRICVVKLQKEWVVDRILSHKGKGRKATLQLKWKAGDVTWEPYRVVRHLEALESYFEVQGVTSVGKLAGAQEDADGSEPEDLELNCIMLDQHICYKNDSIKRTTHQPTPLDPHPQFNYTRSPTSSIAMNPHEHYLHTIQLITDAHKAACATQERMHEQSRQSMVQAMEVAGRIATQAAQMAQAAQANRSRPKNKPKKKSNNSQKKTGKSDCRGRYRKAKEAKARAEASNVNTHHMNDPSTHNQSPLNDSMLGLGQADWTNTAFTTQDLLTGTQADQSPPIVMPAPVPAPAYTPTDETATGVPAHSTHIQTSASANPSEPKPNESSASQSTSAAAHESHEESTIDYEDETMEDAGDAGTH